MYYQKDLKTRGGYVMSKKVLFDLDNTLIGSYRNREGKLVLEARPGVLDLLNKLREFKKQHDVQYILFTSVPKNWVETGITILEAHDFFDDIICRDTLLPIEPGSIEEKIFGLKSEFHGLKPFTVLKGDLLLIEDNPIMQKAGEAIKLEYKEKESERKIDICKVTFYEAVDPRRYDIIEELERTEEKTDFNTKRLQHMRDNLDKIGVDNQLEMEKVYDSIVQFIFNTVQSPADKNIPPQEELTDFESQVQKLIDLYF